PARGSPRARRRSRRDRPRPATLPVSPRRPRRGTLAPVISVVVPVQNEEHSVEPLLGELAHALEPLETSWEVIFVDDGSTDATWARLSRLHDLHENVRVVRLRRNFGKAAALAAGFAEATGEIVVPIDGDRQDDPEEIPRLLAKL